MEKPKIVRTKTMTMNWDGLGDWDDDDEFFESNDRLSCAVPLDLASSGSDDDDEDFEDSRVSFASTASSVYLNKSKRFGNGGFSPTPISMSSDYNIWMNSPVSIKERRQRLFQGMGLSSGKNFLSFKHNVCNKAPNGKVQKNKAQVPMAVKKDVQTPQHQDTNKDGSVADLCNSPLPVLFVRSRSDGEIDSHPIEKKRKDQLLGSISKQRLTRTYSVISTQHPKWYPYHNNFSPHENGAGKHGAIKQSRNFPPMLANQRYGAFFLIKNLDTGKEFIVNENDEDGMWNKVSDLQTGKQLTMEEFEKSVGHSPVVRELMRRESFKSHSDRKINSYLSKSLKKSKRRGAAMLRTIKGVASSMSIKGDKEKEKEKEKESEKEKEKEKEKEAPVAAMDHQKNTKKNNWVKVRETGKSYKELSALHLCQEILAHEGSIWTIRFSIDAKLLASAGEDRIIHVWEVQECHVLPSTEGCAATPIHPSLASNTPLHPSLTTPQDQSGSSDASANPNDKKKKGKTTKKANHIPDYVHVPETVFSLSDKPICSLKGHLDDILDLSWSSNQHLLSSSMDKTVRLWDLETKRCLKLFAHNDYVTCIQFNPMNDDYFISGSLDAKVRIWSIPNRKVVDWAELHEMVTAACYTPDGQGALIGCHKGSCRMYNTEGCKLEQMDQIAIINKKKAHKITGFQFCPINPAEVLVTSADSRVRIVDGTEVVYKFRGIRNTSSQIAASYTQDGKYVITASEDSQVYVWKSEEPRNTGTGKRNVAKSRGYEHFTCKDVSVAIPWNGTVKGDPPSIIGNSKKHNKKSPVKHTNSNPDSTTTTKEDSPRGNNKKWLPSLPKLKHNHQDRAGIAPEEEHSRDSQTETSTGEEVPSDLNSRSIKQSDSSSSISSGAACDSITHGDSSSFSSAAGQTSGASSVTTTWSLHDVGHGNCPTQPTAWGLVIVTATLGGEIRVYQNFGLPCRQGALTHTVKLT